MPVELVESWITSHGLPMVITIVVIFLLFRYFMKQLNSQPNQCKPDILNKLTEIHKDIVICHSLLGNLKGFLSGLYFRNGGTDDD